MAYANGILLGVVLGIMELLSVGYCRYDVWNEIACTQYFRPDNCNLSSIDVLTVDDFDRCAPSYLSVNARNHYLGATGRRITYKNNKDAYDRIQIQPKMLRDVSKNSLKTTFMGLELDFPIGISPVAYHKLASKGGEIDTVKALRDFRTIMILSMYSNVLLEDVARAVKRDGHPHLFMQVYLFANLTISIDVIRRAEKAGFKAIVLTSDSPILNTVSCDSRNMVNLPPGVGAPNTNNVLITDGGLKIATFEDITMLKKYTKLPIIAKGILSGSDAVKALDAGAAAIMVSNHGGRQMDGAPATIDALPGVVAAVKQKYPKAEILMDGGIRSGNDVFKSLVRGAAMSFVGRPSIWGLVVNGSQGVKRVINILTKELNETMIISGSRNPADIDGDILIETPSAFYNSFNVY